MDEATDPKNQFAFTVGNPTMDYAAQALGRHTTDYFKKYDKNPDRPMVRDAYLWSVTRR